MAVSKMSLGGVTSIIVDDDQFAVNLVGQMLRGLGLDNPAPPKRAPRRSFCSERIVTIYAFARPSCPT